MWKINHLFKCRSKIINEIDNIFKLQGNTNYIGESISQVSHAVQVAKSAEKRNNPINIVVAGFLHDIGHMLPHEEIIKNNKGENIGALNHEKLAASWLRDRGFKEDVTIPIEKHCEAKRYLVTLDKGYINNLSGSSRETLLNQGNRMSEIEINKFYKNRYISECIELRMNDDLGKDKNISPDEIRVLYDRYLGITDKYLKNISN